MGYSAKAVANHFLDLAQREGKPLTPLKLQKLVYVAHGWHLAICDTPLVNNEFAEAWQYGPVFPSLYHEFKDLGRGPITRRASSLSVETESDGKSVLKVKIIEPTVSGDDASLEVLSHVWSTYGKLSGLQMSDMTHRDGTPWEQVRTATGGVNNADIPNEIIKAHYVDLALRRRAAREGAEKKS